MKYNKLTKQGKKKKSQFFKVAMTASVLLVSSSTALFIPLINSMNQTNEALTAQIEDANKQTEIIQKNNQNPAAPSRIPQTTEAAYAALHTCPKAELPILPT